MKIEAICFDMDGTLIRYPDSVRYLCSLNGNSKSLEGIEKLESDGIISWIDADYKKSRLIKGLSVEEVEDNFKRNIKIIQNLDRVSMYLREREIKQVLITAGPIQVAEILSTQFSFNGVYGSLYEVQARKFTGRIISHLGSENKLSCLREFCLNNNIALDHCVAIGDGESDIGIFEKCGRSIAINYSDAIKGKATEQIITDDLSDIISILEYWLSE
ncbi:MAG: HAD-IB family phosphatase [candidate division Zixibacteria bacterium]|nr:HAD-IB family phosphatase [candidate division Zixibacteria bacterium]